MGFHDIPSYSTSNPRDTCGIAGRLECAAFGGHGFSMATGARASPRTAAARASSRMVAEVASDCGGHEGILEVRGLEYDGFE